MTHDRYTKHVSKASALIQHLGRAVRGSRAFFVFRDRSDPVQPQIIACHPPLTEAELLRCLASEHVVYEQVGDDASHEAIVGVVSELAFENHELAHEMTAVAAQSLATEIDGTSETFDGGTGLPDRAAFLHLLTQRMEAAAGVGVALLIIDIDRFHRVIAQFGDTGGDDLVKLMATRLVDLVESRTVGDGVLVLIYKPSS